MWAEVGHEVGNGRFASNKNPTREIQFPYNEFVAGKVVWGGNGRLWPHLSLTSAIRTQE
jgi:hypothetical protein